MSNRLLPHLESSTQAIALAIIGGAEARVVGEKLLTGLPIRFLEIDGHPVPVPEKRQKEFPGVRVTYRDGYVALYPTTNDVRAEALLGRALALAKPLDSPA